MSRAPADGGRPGRGFPRASGDEPYVGKTKDALTMFSPRERG